MQVYRFVPHFCLLLLFATATGQAQSSQPQSANSRAPLQPCELTGLKEPARCGSYEVYEDRARGSGRKISLNIVVLPALSKTPAPDPLVVFVGGPGQGATEDPAGQARRFADIRQHRDILLVDQRGTGKSNRLNCDLGGLDGTIDAFVAGNFPLEKLRQCRAELEQQADLRLYTTPIAMDDLDEVRSWLGYEKINLYGGSYGTRPALVYLKRYPNRVRTVTVRGVYSLNPLYFARDTQRALNLLFDDCAKEESCAKAYPKLRDDLQTVLSNLEKTPAILERINSRNGSLSRVTITRQAFLGGVRRLLYDSETQRQIPLMIHKAMQGNYQPFEMVVSQTTGILDSFSSGMFFSVICPEGVARIKTDEIKSTAASNLFDDYMVSGAIKACQQWPVGQLPADYFAPVKSQAPALILSGQIDPVTPPVWGDEISRHLPNSLHLTMAGIAHSPFPDCAAQIMTKFLETAELKNADTSCLADLKRRPFIRPSRALPPTLEVSNELAKELVGLDQRLLELVTQADRAQLNHFIPDDFQQFGLLDPTKDRQNKAQWIDRAVQVATRVENATFKLEQPQVTFFGDVALINARWSLEGTLNDRPFASTIIIMDVWRKREGRWEVVQRQLADAKDAQD